MTLSETRLPSITHSLLILIAAACGMCFLLALLPAPGHDQLWFLLLAQRVLHGAAPYGPQAFDPNPPAILWLSTIPVFLAQHLYLPTGFTAKLLCLLLILAIALLLRCAPRPTTPRRLFLLFAFLLLTSVIPARDFGQRDHLTAVLLLPYLVTGFDPPSRRSSLNRTALAALATLGICLKPQQALVPLVLELVAILRTRRITRPEPWAFLTIGALYLTAIHHFAPLYFSVALPLARSTYWAIGHLTPLQLLREAPQLHLLALLTLALALRRRPVPPQTATLLLAGLAATAAYYLQGTGWYYQQLPALTFFGLALTLQLTQRMGDPGSDGVIAGPQVTSSPLRWLPFAGALLSLLTLVLTFHFSGFPFTRQAFTDPYTIPIQTPDPAFFDHLPPGTSIATLTTSVDDAIMPIYRYHLTWAQRTDNLWLLPAILRSQSGTLGSALSPSSLASHHLTPDRLATLGAQQHRWMVEDFLRWHPTLILVARCQDPAVHCQTLEDRHDDLLAFFLRDPAFAAIFAHYRYLRTSGPYEAYTLTNLY